MSRHGVALAAVVWLSLTACGKKDQRADTSAIGSGATASAAPAAGSTTGASATAGASATLTDPNRVAILDQANAADSARGRLAETKATSADVKNFARMMVGEHHALRQQGQQLAKKLNVTPQPPPNDQSEAQAKT